MQHEIKYIHTYTLRHPYTDMYVNIHTYEIYKHTYNNNIIYIITRASPVAQTVKNLPTMQETRVPSLGQEDCLEKGMATHSNILA